MQTDTHKTKEQIKKETQDNTIIFEYCKQKKAALSAAFSYTI